MKFYNVTDDVSVKEQRAPPPAPLSGLPAQTLCPVLPQDLPKPVRASFILNVETDELFITAGLQDRVVQVSDTTEASPC